MRPLALVLVLAGCTPAPDNLDRPTPIEDRTACGAGEAQALVGQRRAVLASVALPAGTRVIEPGMAITEDFSPDRLNIDLDANGRIVRVWCG